MAPDIVQLNVRDNGFDIVVHAELPVANKIDWSDIKKIEAYRSDDGGKFTVRLKVSLYWGRHRVLIDEFTSGFGDLTKALVIVFPSLAKDWEGRIWAPVGFPPHEVIYEAS